MGKSSEPMRVLTTVGSRLEGGGFAPSSACMRMDWWGAMLLCKFQAHTLFLTNKFEPAQPQEHRPF